MSSPKISRLSTPSPVPAKNSPTKVGQTASNRSSELNKWVDTKLGEWESGKQERDIRVSSLVEGSQVAARERNKKMQEEIQKMRDEFEQKMAEPRKTDHNITLDSRNHEINVKEAKKSINS